MRIAVLGGGSWGTCLARVFVDRGHLCALWIRNAEVAASIRVERQNLYHLPGVLLPPQLTTTGSLDAVLRGAELVVVAVPFPSLRAALGEVRMRLADGVPLLIGTRGLGDAGLHPSGPCSPVELATEMVPQANGQLLALGGPLMASEVARGLPSTAVLAGPEGPVRDAVRAALVGPNLPVVATTDVLGVEVAAALRGVVALAAGLCEGLELGEGARAMILARGHGEMAALGLAMGGRADTFAGPAGLAALALACGSARSSDWQVGYLLGRGVSLPQLRGERQLASAEVLDTASAAAALARSHGVRALLFSVLARSLASGRPVREALLELLVGTGLGAGSQADALEMDQIDEGGEALSDRREVQGAKAVQAEILDRIRSEHRPEDHGGADVGGGSATGAREPAHEPAGEGIARPGGIDDRLDREGGSGENPTLVEQQRSGIPPLDDDGPGPEGADRSSRGRKVRPPR